MSYVNNYTINGTFSNGELIFETLNGLTYSVELGSIGGSTGATGPVGDIGPTGATGADATLSSRLTAWDGYNANGLLVQTSTTTWSNITLQPGNATYIINSDGVSGDPTIGVTGGTISGDFETTGWMKSDRQFIVNPTLDAGDDNSKVFTWNGVTGEVEITNASALGGGLSQQQIEGLI